MNYSSRSHKYWEQYYKKYKEILLVQHQKHYYDNKKRILLQRKKYKADNKDKLKQNAKEYYQQNKKRIRTSHDNWKQKNIERVRLVARQTSLKRREKISAWWINFKKQYCCVSCGETDPIVLDFHHTIPKDKTGTVSQLVWRSNIPKLLLEVKKCRILCANCHRKWHHFNREIL